MNKHDINLNHLNKTLRQMFTIKKPSQTFLDKYIFNLIIAVLRSNLRNSVKLKWSRDKYVKVTDAGWPKLELWFYKNNVVASNV